MFIVTEYAALTFDDLKQIELKSSPRCQSKSYIVSP